MASQAIKEYDDFAGQDGYVIVDGLDDQTPGGKKLLSTIGGGAGGGMTMGTPITVTSDMVQRTDPSDPWTAYLDVTVVNNTYTILTLPANLFDNGAGGKNIDVPKVIRLNITSSDLPNFIFHIKNQSTLADWETANVVIEVHYKTDENAEEIVFDHHRPGDGEDGSERAPIAYGPSENNGFTGDTIVTVIGRYFEIKQLYSHVPPSGSWNGIYS